MKINWMFTLNRVYCWFSSLLFLLLLGTDNSVQKNAQEGISVKTCSAKCGPQFKKKVVKD